MGRSCCLSSWEGQMEGAVRYLQCQLQIAGPALALMASLMRAVSERIDGDAVQQFLMIHGVSGDNHQGSPRIRGSPSLAFTRRGSSISANPDIVDHAWLTGAWGAAEAGLQRHPGSLLRGGAAGRDQLSDSGEPRPGCLPQVDVQSWWGLACTHAHTADALWSVPVCPQLRPLSWPLRDVAMLIRCCCQACAPHGGRPHSCRGSQ